MQDKTNHQDNINYVSIEHFRDKLNLVLKRTAVIILCNHLLNKVILYLIINVHHFVIYMKWKLRCWTRTRSFNFVYEFSILLIQN